MTVHNTKPKQIENLTIKKIKKNHAKKDVIESTPHSPAGTHNGANVISDDQDIRVRKYGESVYKTLSSVASVLEYPKGMLNGPIQIYTLFH